jgi:hypothetical protein
MFGFRLNAGLAINLLDPFETAHQATLQKSKRRWI